MKTPVFLAKTKQNRYAPPNKMAGCSSSLVDIENLSKSSPSSSVSIEHVPHTSYVSPPDDVLKRFVPELIELMSKKAASKKRVLTKEDIDELNNKLRAKYRLVVSKPDLRRIYETHFYNSPTPALFQKWLIKRATRANSGVLVVTITLSPHKFSCKYDCAYCPQETDLAGNHTQPRSYLSTEPAMLRAIGTRTDTNSYDFDVGGQFKNRVQSYMFNGSMTNRHGGAKIEVILSGGTWHSYPKSYRDQVVNEVYYNANIMHSKDSRPTRPMLSIQEEIKINETADFRIIGLTGETRPDNVTEQHIQEALSHGFTRWQLGEQTDNDTILKKINRKCYKADTIRAHRLLKQAGFKVVAHLMPDLPGSSPPEDIRMFNSYLSDPDLQFDDVKIYPTAICQSASPDRIVTSKIADWYKAGTYKPYGETNLNDLITVISHYLVRVPPHVRIERIVRDIPSQSIEAGYNKMSNLRQLIQNKLAQQKLECNDIFTKEIGDKTFEPYLEPLLVVRPYKASQGMEYHISYEIHDFTPAQKLSYYADRTLAAFKWLFTGRYNYWCPPPLTPSYKALIGFCRLRDDPNPGGTFVPEINKCALIREVHVYGFSLGVGSDAASTQHRGFGKALVHTAESIAQNLGYTKTAVIAGVGTREYYKHKCGYHSGAHYMLKDLPPTPYAIWRPLTLALCIGATAALLRSA